MQPFSDLLEINMKLALHELKYVTKEEKFVHQFKYDAIVKIVDDFPVPGSPSSITHNLLGNPSDLSKSLLF
jgi:hypothetical protein